MHEVPLGVWVRFFPSICIISPPLFVLGAAHITADPTPPFSATSTHPRGGGERDKKALLASPREAVAVSRRGPAALSSGYRGRLRLRPGWERGLPCA